MKYQKRRLSLGTAVLAFLLALGLALNAMTTLANADENQSSSEIRAQIDEMESQQAEIEAQIQELEEQLQENLSEMEAIVLQKSIIDQEIFLLHKQVDNTNEMISAYNVLIADKQEELTAAETRLAQLNEQNKERIRAMEEDGALSYWSVLFKANSFSDLLDRLNMIEEIAAADQRRLNEMREAADKVAAAQAELMTEKMNLEQVREQLALTEAELLAKRTEADVLLAQLIATGEEYEAYMEESEERQNQLAQEIAQKEQEFEDAQESEYWEAYWATYTEPPTTTEPPYEPPTEPENGDYGSDVNASGWCNPLVLETWITSPYGMRWHPIHYDWRMHNGVDLAGDFGDPIVATRSGVVTVADYEYGGAGYYVTINHGDGYSSTYMHMTHFIVEVGDRVEAGQKIGEVGSTGGSTGPHLHFGIYYNGQSVNPADYVDF